MNKKILLGLIALTLVIPSTSHANVKNRTVSVPTLAILDTGLDTSVPSIKEKLIYEVCILEWTTCPNGQSFMEGPGAASIPLQSITKNGFSHGTQMASAAVSTNPNMNIVFVRIIGQNINGDRQIANEQTVYNALNWVYANKDKFNIQAVSLSQGSHNLGSSESYCPSTPITQKSIIDLLSAGIPTFTAVGNNRDYKRIDWPSCIPEAVAVGAGSKNGIELYNNYDPVLLDMYSIGQLRVYSPGNNLGFASGSSIAAQTAAANWIALKQFKPGYTIAQINDLIANKSAVIKMGKRFPQIGKLFELKTALS
jgi:acid stress-induced BolA-like protein IbaG/YrbA